MRYDSLCEYSNKQHSTHHQYYLPFELIQEGDDEIVTEHGTMYSLTPMVVDVQLNPLNVWTGRNDEFTVNITPEQVQLLMDDRREIRYEKVNGAFLGLVKMIVKLYLVGKLQ